MRAMGKMMCGAGMAVFLLMCSCANSSDVSFRQQSYAAERTSAGLAPAHSENSGDISYDSVIEEIEGYCGRYISMNIEENEVVREEWEAAELSSEGGVTEVFRGTDNEPVRYRCTMYGAMGQAEENYYIIGEGKAYFTRLEKNYDTYHLERADILNYAFSEYWLAGGRTYYLDRAEKKLVICGEDPVPEYFPKV